MTDEAIKEESREPENLLTLKQVEVPFLDEMIMALLGNDGEIYVPVTSFAQNLGMSNPYSQIQRIKRDDALFTGLRMMTIASAGGPQATQCLRLNTFALWLATISERICKPEIRPRLTHYKLEAADAILNYFREKAIIRTIISPQALTVPGPSASYEEWAAFYETIAGTYRALAAQQAQLTDHEKRLTRNEEEIAVVVDEVQGLKETLAIMGEWNRRVGYVWIGLIVLAVLICNYLIVAAY